MKDTTNIKVRAVLDAGLVDANDIHYMLNLRGYTQSSLAREMGLVPTTVGNVIHGRESSAPVAYRIAEIIGTTTGRLWPGRYPNPPRYNKAVKARRLPGILAEQAV